MPTDSGLLSELQALAAKAPSDLPLEVRGIAAAQSSDEVMSASVGGGSSRGFGRSPAFVMAVSQQPLYVTLAYPDFVTR